MNLADMPTRVAIPFANSAGNGYIRPVPVPSQIGVSPGTASFTDGFTPDTFQPLAGGGAYVNGEDMNGILNFVTKWTRWGSAGGPAVFDAGFSVAIGGYPKGAQLSSTAYNGVVWMNQVDGNTTDPDGGAPAGWVQEGAAAATLAQAQAAALGNVFLSPLVLAELLNSVDGQTLRLPNGTLLKMGAVAITRGGSSTRTALAFTTRFPNTFGGLVSVANGVPDGNWSAITVYPSAFTVAGGTLVADTCNSVWDITNNISAYWIAWGT